MAAYVAGPPSVASSVHEDDSLLPVPTAAAAGVGAVEAALGDASSYGASGMYRLNGLTEAVDGNGSAAGDGGADTIGTTTPDDDDPVLLGPEPTAQDRALGHLTRIRQTFEAEIAAMRLLAIEDAETWAESLQSHELGLFRVIAEERELAADLGVAPPPLSIHAVFAAPVERGGADTAGDHDSSGGSSQGSRERLRPETPAWLTRVSNIVAAKHAAHTIVGVHHECHKGDGADADADADADAKEAEPDLGPPGKYPRPYLTFHFDDPEFGCVFVTAEKEEGRKHGKKVGVRLGSVKEDGPAYQMGAREGDVVVSVDGSVTAGVATKVVKALLVGCAKRVATGGDPMVLEVWRAGLGADKPTLGHVSEDETEETKVAMPPEEPAQAPAHVRLPAKYQSIAEGLARMRRNKLREKRRQRQEERRRQRGAGSRSPSRGSSRSRSRGSYRSQSRASGTSSDYDSSYGRTPTPIGGGSADAIASSATTGAAAGDDGSVPVGAGDEVGGGDPTSDAGVGIAIRGARGERPYRAAARLAGQADAMFAKAYEISQALAPDVGEDMDGVLAPMVDVDVGTPDLIGEYANEEADGVADGDGSVGHDGGAGAADGVAVADDAALHGTAYHDYDGGASGGGGGREFRGVGSRPDPRRHMYAPGRSPGARLRSYKHALQAMVVLLRKQAGATGVPPHPQWGQSLAYQEARQAALRDRGFRTGEDYANPRDSAASTAFPPPPHGHRQVMRPSRPGDGRTRGRMRGRGGNGPRQRRARARGRDGSSGDEAAPRAVSELDGGEATTSGASADEGADDAFRSGTAHPLAAADTGANRRASVGSGQAGRHHSSHPSHRDAGIAGGSARGSVHGSVHGSHHSLGSGSHRSVGGGESASASARGSVGSRGAAGAVNSARAPSPEAEPDAEADAGADADAATAKAAAVDAIDDPERAASALRQAYEEEVLATYANPHYDGSEDRPVDRAGMPLYGDMPQGTLPEDGGVDPELAAVDPRAALVESGVAIGLDLPWAPGTYEASSAQMGPNFVDGKLHKAAPGYTFLGTGTGAVGYDPSDEADRSHGHSHGHGHGHRHKHGHGNGHGHGDHREDADGPSGRARSPSRTSSAARGDRGDRVASTEPNPMQVHALERTLIEFETYVRDIPATHATNITHVRVGSPFA